MARHQQRRIWVVVAVLAALVASGCHDAAIGAGTEADQAVSEVGFDLARHQAAAQPSSLRSARPTRPRPEVRRRGRGTEVRAGSGVIRSSGPEPANGPPPHRGPPPRG